MRIRIGATLLATLLGGCVYYPPYQYVADPHGDYYYEPEPDYGYQGYASLGYGYGAADYWYGWFPTYAWYPGWGAYYGVTWAPYWGRGWYDSWAWYHAYSPYYYSYYDSYYDWHGHHGHHGHDGHGGHDARDGPHGGAGGGQGDPRFGSASNEAERLANMDAPRGGGYGYLRSTPGGTAARWSRGRDANGWQEYPDVRAGEPGAAGERYYPGDTRFNRPGATYAPGVAQPGTWARGRDPGGGGYGNGPARSYAPARGGPAPGRSAPAPGRESRGSSNDSGGSFDRGGSSGSSAPSPSHDWGSSGGGGSRDRDPD